VDIQKGTELVRFNSSEARLIYDAFISSTDLEPEQLYDAEKYPQLANALQKLEGVVNRGNSFATLSEDDLNALAKYSTTLEKFRRQRRK